MKKTILFVLVLALVVGLIAGVANAKVVACVGASNKYGYGLANRQSDCYPAQLAKMLRVFDREWEVVQRELERDLDNPNRQLFYLMQETMYRVHPIRYPIIGHQPIVQKLTKEDIVGYYRRMYVPDNIVVCIAGDINLDETLATVKKEFASFDRRPVPTIALPEEPEMVTPRVAI